MPNRSLPLAPAALAVGLAAGLAACASDAPTAVPSPAAASALRAAATPARSYFVDPAVGRDGNAGTQASPLKSLARALFLATAGDTVRLAKGNYSSTGSTASGDVFPLHVRSRVTVLGTVQPDGSATGTVLRPASSDAQTPGLVLDGDATLQDLDLTQFGTAVSAREGRQTLRHVRLVHNVTALSLTGSAEAALLNSLAAVGVGGTAVRATNQAQVTLRGDTLSGLFADCATGEGVVDLGEASRATVDGLVVDQVPGPALRLRDGAAATAHDLTAKRVTAGSCAGSPGAHVVASDSASLTMSGSHLSAAGGANARGVEWGSRGALALSFSRLAGFTGAAVNVAAAGVVTVNGVIVDSVGTGVRVVNHPDATVRVDNSTFVRSGTGIRAAVFRVRNTQFLGNVTGVLIRGSGADLGKLAEPGNNTFVNNANTGLTFENVLGVTLTAAGNTWNPLVQGADASGRYQHKVLSPTSADAQGPNFRLVKGTRLSL